MVRVVINIPRKRITPFIDLLVGSGVEKFTLFGKPCEMRGADAPKPGWMHVSIGMREEDARRFVAALTAAGLTEFGVGPAPERRPYARGKEAAGCALN